MRSVGKQGPASDHALRNNARPTTGTQGQNPGENRGHQRGVSTAAYGEVLMATVTAEYGTSAPSPPVRHDEDPERQQVGKKCKRSRQ